MTEPRRRLSLMLCEKTIKFVKSSNKK